MNMQDDTLSGTLASVDIATEQNLNDLVKVGEALLKKPVSRVNFDTDKSKPVRPEVTNAEALVRIASVLSKERAQRSKVVHERT
ncbi:PREDICTED: patatin-like protein 3 [Prunus mume]|uniref:Patatin-like protein 3 n=1 Tax=Prunus mume TaxID=102107 RepID=A0ABM1LJC5_PRUMU|nr:PREDICTED: patatin-like protein 3 [Prunus mume]